MNDKQKTKNQLVQEMAQLRQHAAKLESALVEYKRTEEQLWASQNRYRTLIENIPQKMFGKDKDSVYVTCNQNFASDLGTNVEEVVGRTDFDFFPKELADQYRADDLRIMQSGQTEEIEEKYVKQGDEFWVHTIKTPVRDKQGNIAGILGVFWDITTRKQMEDERLQQWEQFLTIVSSFPEVLYVVDPETYEVLFVNKAFQEMLGNDPVGKICYDVFQGFSAPCEFCTNDIIMETRQPYTWEYHNPLLDRDYLINDQMIKWPDGRDVRFEIAIDITDRKRTEQQLEELVQKRTAELDNINQELQQEIETGRRREEIIRRQADEILEISTPVLEIWEGVVVAPLIGMLDSQRTQRFMEVLLERIVATKSAIALVDITGVPTIDTQTAYHLIETISAVRLLGAQVLLTGVSPQIAQTLVHLGIDLGGVTTHSSLMGGLRLALDSMDLMITNDDYAEILSGKNKRVNR